MKENKKKGFTLVELLAVIVILAIILVIAVPKVMSIIKDAKKGTLETTAKMIASAAEKAKIQNTVLGNDDEIKCRSIVKLNDDDYGNCVIDFDGNTAIVTLEGKGNFAGLYVCRGTKLISTATNKICRTGPSAAETIMELYKNAATENGLQHIIIEQSVASSSLEDDLDAGIRYIGEWESSKVKNKVYFNCEPDDGTYEYGHEDYSYDSSCETWRILGVFDVEDGKGNTEKRLKIINKESKFYASWDSSDSTINNGGGVNQWGPSIIATTGTPAYEGADLMQLLNGFYIGVSGSQCKYNNRGNQSGFEHTCTKESLTTKKMKPLTSTALNMISNAVWYTYAVETPAKPQVYLEERGITTKHTGCGNGIATTVSECSIDGVTRNNEWVGLVGLMSQSDDVYLGSWLYKHAIGSYEPWTMTPSYNYSAQLWGATDYGSTSSASLAEYIMPVVYLSADIQIVGGDGYETPYKLK